MSAEPWAMVNQDESQDNAQLGLAECEQDEDQESQHLGEEVTSEEGSNNELFDCLVQITIAGQQLLVYHSSSRQCEWNIQGISNFFFRTADKKKATDLFRERKEIIMNYQSQGAVAGDQLDSNDSTDFQKVHGWEISGKNSGSKRELFQHLWQLLLLFFAFLTGEGKSPTASTVANGLQDFCKNYSPLLGKLIFSSVLLWQTMMKTTLTRNGWHWLWTMTWDYTHGICSAKKRFYWFLKNGIKIWTKETSPGSRADSQTQQLLNF